MERGQNPDIIQGRMPVAVVHLARFGNHKGDATKDLAALFGTTVGKVDDIKKSRNFAYVTEDVKFTQAQIDEGAAWLKKHPKYDTAGTDALVVELESYPVATEEEAKEFDAKRTAARGQPTTTKTGEVADGGGGNRRKSSKKKEKAAEGDGTAAPAEPSADDLLTQ